MYLKHWADALRVAFIHLQTPGREVAWPSRLCLLLLCSAGTNRHMGRANHQLAFEPFFYMGYTTLCSVFKAVQGV